MRVLILAQISLKNEKMFKKEVDFILDTHCTKEIEFVYAEYSYNKIISNYVKNKKCKSKVFKNKSTSHISSKLLDKMIDYVLEYEDSLIIDFEDYYKFSKKKKILYQEISPYVNIFLVFFTFDSDVLKCCDQELIFLDSTDQLDVFECFVCKNKYALSQTLVDMHLVETTKEYLLQRLYFRKGEYS